MNIVFLSPIFLWLLVSIPLLIITHFFALHYLRRRALKFANFEAIKRVTGSEGTSRNTVAISKNLPLLALKILVLVLMICSAAQPVLYYSGKSGEFSFVLAIDSSSSMLTQDFTPNRLEAAKKAANTFVDSVSADTNIGVISFAGSSVVEQTQTNSIISVRNAISGIKISNIGGTSIGDALINSVNLLSNEEKAKVIILLSDGQSNTGATPEDGILYVNRNNIIVYTIGVGTEAGGSFIRGNAISKLDEETLTLIAEKTGGKYFRAQGVESLTKAYLDIASYTKQKIGLNLSGGFLIASLLLLFIEWGLVNTRYRTLP